MTKWISLVAFCFTMSWAFAADTKTVTLLDKGEPYGAMVFHADHLWVGHSRKNFNADYKVQIFDRKDQLVSEIPLPHAPQVMYPYDDSSILIVGIGHTPNLTMYTLISHRGGSFPNRTRIIPMEAWANQWLGTFGGREYFTDPGGNPNDEAVTTDLTLASQTLFRMDGDTPKYLPTRMRLPVGGVVVDKSLFVIQKDAMTGPKSNLVQVDPATGKSSNLFAIPRQDLHVITKVPGTSLLAILERAANQVLIYDSVGKTLVSEVAVDRGPKPLKAMKNCLFVGSFEERSIQMLKRAPQGNFEVAAKLNNTMPTSEFKKLSEIAVDEKTGRVYARSNFPCNPISDSCVDDSNRVISWDALSQTIKESCRN